MTESGWRSRLAPLGNVRDRLSARAGKENRWRFAFRQHDPLLPEPQTEEASRSGSGLAYRSRSYFFALPRPRNVPWSTRLVVTYKLLPFKDGLLTKIFFITLLFNKKITQKQSFFEETSILSANK